MKIETVADLDRALKDGPFAWPGGYPLYFITAHDSTVLCFNTVKNNYALVSEAVRTQDRQSGWCVCAVDINWEDMHMVCEDTGEDIPCAYPSDDTDEDTES